MLYFVLNKREGGKVCETERFTNHVLLNLIFLVTLEFILLNLSSLSRFYINFNRSENNMLCNSNWIKLMNAKEKLLHFWSFLLKFTCISNLTIKVFLFLFEQTFQSLRSESIKKLWQKKWNVAEFQHTLFYLNHFL